MPSTKKNKKPKKEPVRFFAVDPSISPEVYKNSGCGFVFDDSIEASSILGRGLSAGIVEIEREETATASVAAFSNAIYDTECTKGGSCVLMKRVGVVIRDNEGNRVHTEQLPWLYWLSDDPDTWYAVADDRVAITRVNWFE